MWHLQRSHPGEPERRLVRVALHGEDEALTCPGRETDDEVWAVNLSRNAPCRGTDKLVFRVRAALHDERAFFHGIEVNERYANFRSRQVIDKRRYVFRQPGAAARGIEVAQSGNRVARPRVPSESPRA